MHTRGTPHACKRRKINQVAFLQHYSRLVRPRHTGSDVGQVMPPAFSLRDYPLIGLILIRTIFGLGLTVMGTVFAKPLFLH